MMEYDQLSKCVHNPRLEEYPHQVNRHVCGKGVGQEHRVYTISKHRLCYTEEREGGEKR